MKTEKYWNVFININEMIRFSDTKAGILITVYGVLLTIVYSNSTNVYEAISKNGILVLFTIIIGIFSLLSIICCFLTLNPRLKNSNPTSVIYFGHIHQNYPKYQDYYKAIDSSIDNGEFNKHIAEQIYVNSKIAESKFTYVSWGIRFFSLSIIFLIINLLIYFT